MTEEENPVSEKEIAESGTSDQSPPKIGEREENDYKNVDEKNVKKAETVSKKPIRYRAPLYIAGCIMLAAVLVFGICACFLIPILKVHGESKFRQAKIIRR